MENMKRTTEKVALDKDKLEFVLSERNITKEGLSYELGRSKSYICNVLRRGTISPREERVICKMLDLEEGTFVKQEEQALQAQPFDMERFESIRKGIGTVLEGFKASIADTLTEQVVNPTIRTQKEIENQTKALSDIARCIRNLTELVSGQNENIEKILSKTNANTLQLERMKDDVRAVVHELKLTDYDRAVDFLKNVLKNGRVLKEEVEFQAKNEGIKEADLFKAKRDIHVDTATTGYGKGQKTWWFL